MDYKQFKNNNFNVKADEPNQNLIEDLCNDGSLDFDWDGNMFMLGNSMAAASLINHNTQCVYIISEDDMKRYKEGYSVKLIANSMIDEEE